MFVNQLVCELIHPLIINYPRNWICPLSNFLEKKKRKWEEKKFSSKIPQLFITGCHLEDQMLHTLNGDE